MKKILAKVVIIIAVFAITITSLPLMNGGVDAYAAPKSKTKPKLSTSSVTIVMGGRHTIKLKKGKGSWSIKGNGVAKIQSKTRKSATITPIRAGNTVLTCKVGKKKLKCKIKVLNNKVGDVTDYRWPATIVGNTLSHNFNLPKGVSLAGSSFDNQIGKLTITTELNSSTGVTSVSMKVKALKPGQFNMRLNYLVNGEKKHEDVSMIFINGFRGKTKTKKTNANYKSWRKKTISTMVNADMTTWEIVDAIGYLISSGRYSSKGGADGKQLWYGGNGTCVSGAKMMNDFMKDLGVASTIKFMGNKGGSRDIYGYNIMYMSQHKNTWITLGGKKYELNPQPGMPWPMGIVKR